MGLLKKHKGKGCSFTFFLHVHNLTWTSTAGSVCVRYERGSHSGTTRAAAPAGPRSGDLATYVFEEQMLPELPATLYQVPPHPPLPLLPPLPAGLTLPVLKTPVAEYTPFLFPSRTRRRLRGLAARDWALFRPSSCRWRWWRWTTVASPHPALPWAPSRSIWQTMLHPTARLSRPSLCRDQAGAACPPAVAPPRCC